MGIVHVAHATDVELILGRRRTGWRIDIARQQAVFARRSAGSKSVQPWDRQPATSLGDSRRFADHGSRCRRGRSCSLLRSSRRWLRRRTKRPTSDSRGSRCPEPGTGRYSSVPFASGLVDTAMQTAYGETNTFWLRTQRSAFRSNWARMSPSLLVAHAASREAVLPKRVARNRRTATVRSLATHGEGNVYPLHTPGCRRPPCWYRGEHQARCIPGSRCPLRGSSGQLRIRQDKAAARCAGSTFCPKLRLGSRRSGGASWRPICGGWGSLAS